MGAKFPVWAISGFIVLSLFGVVLRYMQLFPLPGFNYMFLLHAHSHFAFAGWTFFSLAFLIFGSGSSGFTPALKRLGLATLISSYGMVVTFSLQGYKVVSIAFSTLFILVTYHFTYLVYRQYRKKWNMNFLSSNLMWGGIVYLCLSSLGPFALGPLMSAGMRGSPLYQNAIYYYLHFQMNGWMMLGALALLVNSYFPGPVATGKSTKGWLFVFILSNIPLFALFTLWAHPSAWVRILALAGSLAQLISWLVLCGHFSRQRPKLSFLAYAALLAVSIKSVMQLVVCIPAVAEWTFLNRNLIIGYIHLITLGIITPLIFDQFVKRGYFNTTSSMKNINVVYIAWVVFYLILLFFQPLLSMFSIGIPYFQLALLVVSFGFLLIGFWYLKHVAKVR